MFRIRFFMFAALAVAPSACGGGATAPTQTFLPVARNVHHASDGAYIKHVVIIVQENRSFDNLFGTFPNANGATRGKNSQGQWVTLKPEKLNSRLALDNSRAAFQVDYDGGKIRALVRNARTPM
jgi:phospholipase C